MARLTPFRSILIANRGEIALRVMRSAKAAGYRTVGVYSDADLRSRHVAEADQAVCIGAARPSASYLNIAAIIGAARRTGADAVHPGYGFLAENADFAQACIDAGLVFIGPSPASIRAMGNKAGAKKIMSAAGVPCVPGYKGDDQSEACLAKEAGRIGYPVMIKAVAGGGGRGMRLVDTAAEFAAALSSACSEANNAFGDPNVILERAIVEPRHIEIQIFADRYGNAIHLGERDCSVQRRHQKLIEEAPSPAVSAELRERMGATAVAAAKAIGYEGAGTLEFLLDREGHYYFMEMNTRLQVEHPVTEAITGLDLVALQLKIAAGEPLPLRQEDVQFRGHAIEVRLCAEDAGNSFLPQSGTMALWQPSPQLRVEHALCSGADIPPYYDSMIAKLITHGDTREEARRKLISGLQDTVALGVTTNQVFLQRCLRHPAFAAGAATTAFVGTHQSELLHADATAEARACAVAAALLLETASGAARGPERELGNRLPAVQRFDFAGRKLQACVTDGGRHRHQVEIEGSVHEIEFVQLDVHHTRLICDGIMQSCTFVRHESRLHFTVDGIAYTVDDTTRAASARAVGGTSDGRLRASMNGRVVAVQVQVGQRVAAGQPVLTLEAMKMEHIHAAPLAGVVTALHVTAGDQVATSRIVAEIEPDALNT